MVDTPPFDSKLRPMPISESLTFENARALSNLYAGEESYLKLVEDAFGVELTARDAVLKVDGPEEGVKSTQNLFQQLHLAAEKGVKIKKHEFKFALAAIKAGQVPRLEDLWSSKIITSPKKPPIVPKTFQQKSYLDAIKTHDLVFGVGPAGTGKTYLAMGMAVVALKNEQVNKIILTRPAVEAGETLGFLPGDLQEKIFPYLRPLYDALNEMMDVDEIQRYMDKGVIEIAPLAYMRGRTLKNAFIILDEGQNTTTEQMFMFLTRLGQDSKCVVTGDPTQIDLPHSRKSGLIESMQALCDVPGISFTKFDEADVVRHELVTRIITAYKTHRGVKHTSMSL
jgi:phosphate starvation-inducible PhoH-like protein